jgi:hypothetical protein
MKEFKKYIVKYLIVILLIFVLRIIIGLIFPELFKETIIGDGFTQTKTTIFSMYQSNAFHFLLAFIMFLDLRKMRKNSFIIPILTIINVTAGLFMFAVLILLDLMSKHDEIQLRKSNL